MTWLDRPPVSWVVWCWETVSRPIRAALAPVERWQARHKARELEELAADLERAGMPGPAVQAAQAAARWRSRA